MEALESRQPKRHFGAISDIATAPQAAAFHRKRMVELTALADTIDDAEARIGILRLAEYHEKAADTLQRLSPERR